MKVKEHIAFYYLLAEVQLHNFILLELNIFFKQHQAQSKLNELLAIHLEYKIMVLLCVDFIVWLSQNICMLEKNCLDYTHSVSSKDYKKNDKIIYKYFNDKYGNISYIYIYLYIYIYIY